MKKMLKILLLGVFIFVLNSAEEASALFVSENDALAVVKTWLEKNPSPMNSQMGNSIREIKHYQGTEYGNPGYYVIFLDPNGWVIVPADDSFEPILAFGDDKLTSEGYNASPLRYMLYIDTPLQAFSIKANQRYSEKDTKLKTRWKVCGRLFVERRERICSVRRAMPGKK
jgi:hypothetical protein